MFLNLRKKYIKYRISNMLNEIIKVRHYKHNCSLFTEKLAIQISSNKTWELVFCSDFSNHELFNEILKVTYLDEKKDSSGISTFFYLSQPKISKQNKILIQKYLYKILFNRDFLKTYNENPKLFTKNRLNQFCQNNAELIYSMINSHNWLPTDIKNILKKENSPEIESIIENSFFNVILKNINENPLIIPSLYFLSEKIELSHPDWPKEFQTINSYNKIDFKKPVLLAPLNVYKDFNKPFKEIFKNIKNKNLKKMLFQKIKINTEYSLEAWFLVFPYFTNKIIKILQIENNPSLQEKLVPILKNIFTSEINLFTDLNSREKTNGLWTNLTNYMKTFCEYDSTILEVSLSKLNFHNQLTLLKGFNKCDTIFDDTLRMISRCKPENIENIPNFNSIRKIHNHIMNNCFPEDLLFFQEHQLSKIDGNEVSFEDSNYILKIPKNSTELIKVGKKLKNCVGNGIYAERIKRKESFIIVGFKDDNPKFCLEVSDILLSFRDLVYSPPLAPFNNDDDSETIPATEHYSNLNQTSDFHIIQAKGYNNTDLNRTFSNAILSEINKKIKN